MKQFQKACSFEVFTVTSSQIAENRLLSLMLVRKIEVYIGSPEEIIKAYLERNYVVRPPGFEPGISGVEGPRPDPG